MYTKIKEQLRTIEFINKYFSKILVQKQDNIENYKKNNDLLLEHDIKDLKEPLSSEEVRLEKAPLSDIFLNSNNYEIILHALTCSNANVS